MGAFFYGVSLQWRLDLRSKTLLITCYLVPLLFFAVMGGIFTAIQPGARDTLLPSMTVFGVTMGAMIGLPPSLVEVYGSDVKKLYQANGVPLSLGLVLSNLSAFLHLFLMSGLLYLAAPLAFDARLPANPAAHFGGTALLIAASLGVASVLGLAVKDQAKTSMASILVFLPSILFSGILFPAELLPEAFALVGNLFPATWGYRLLTGKAAGLSGLWPLLVLLLASAMLCILLLRRARSG